jgi:predicted nucleic acid-binding protein
MIKSYLLDSYAVLCYLRDEPGADTVFKLLNEARNDNRNLLMTWINAGEVYYRVWREYNSQAEAEKVLSLLLAWPLKMLEADEKLTLEAASIKAQNRLSYADAFAIAAAVMNNAAIVTGDPEIQTASSKMGFKLIWLPL